MGEGRRHTHNSKVQLLPGNFKFVRGSHHFLRLLCASDWKYIALCCMKRLISSSSYFSSIGLACNVALSSVAVSGLVSRDNGLQTLTFYDD